MFPGKVHNGQKLKTRVYGLLTPVAFEALQEVRRSLSDQEGREVSSNEAIEWCIRKATRTPLTPE